MAKTDRATRLKAVSLLPMPEAFAVLAVFLVAVVAYVAAWMQSRDPANFNRIEDEARLRQHAAWLASRLELARRENWSDEMVGNLEGELALAMRQLAAPDDRLSAR